MPLVAGVDSSTSACKIEVRDADTGTLVASGRAPHPATNPPRSEQHPDAWWDAFEAAATGADLFGRNRPAAISVAGQQHGLVVLDEAGAVLRPAKLWNDTESAPDATALVDRLGAEAWAAACGSVPVASFTVTKLAWLHRVEPRTFDRVARVLLPHDWLTHRLTGEVTTDRGDASGTGWWSPAEERYRPEVLASVDEGLSTDLLPRVLGPTEVAGEWDGIVVGPGTGDNMAAALGLGLRVGDLALSLGTSGTAFTVSDRPTADASGAVAGFADASGRYLPLVCTLNATKVTDAVARLLGVDAAGLDALALASPPGARGLVLVPHLDGERTPNRPDARGSLFGIGSGVERTDLARAAVEGVVANLLAGADHLPTTEGRILLVGGGSRSAAFRRSVADLTGRPVVVPDEDELVARGAAVQAAAVLHGTSIDAVADAWHLNRGRVVEPNRLVDGAAIRAVHADASGA
ncbi:MAG: xylulokinase [Actinobacteria bacterium]|nr:xylulokinase [Actinomycetota bacterium]